MLRSGCSLIGAALIVTGAGGLIGGAVGEATGAGFDKGWNIGTTIGAAVGLTILAPELLNVTASLSLPTFGWMSTTAGTLVFGVTGSMAVTIPVGSIAIGVGSLGLLMFASNERPGNNVVQNKQFNRAAREAGLNPKDPNVKDFLKEIHRYIRSKKLNLGYEDLVKLIKSWL